MSIFKWKFGKSPLHEIAGIEAKLDEELKKYEKLDIWYREKLRFINEVISEEDEEKLKEFTEHFEKIKELTYSEEVLEKGEEKLDLKLIDLIDGLLGKEQIAKEKGQEEEIRKKLEQAKQGLRKLKRLLRLQIRFLRRNRTIEKFKEHISRLLNLVKKEGQLLELEEQVFNQLSHKSIRNLYHEEVKKEAINHLDYVTQAELFSKPEELDTKSKQRVQRVKRRISKLFETGNWVFHSARVKTSQAILGSGFMSSFVHLQYLGSEGGTFGGTLGISFNFNQVRILNCDNNHVCGFLFPVEKVLKKGRFLGAQVGIAPYELQLLPDGFDAQLASRKEILEGYGLVPRRFSEYLKKINVDRLRKENPEHLFAEVLADLNSFKAYSEGDVDKFQEKQTIRIISYIIIRKNLFDAVKSIQPNFLERLFRVKKNEDIFSRLYEEIKKDYEQIIENIIKNIDLHFAGLEKVDMTIPLKDGIFFCPQWDLSYWINTALSQDPRKLPVIITFDKEILRESWHFMGDHEEMDKYIKSTLRNCNVRSPTIRWQDLIKTPDKEAIFYRDNGLYLHHGAMERFAKLRLEAGKLKIDTSDIPRELLKSVS